MKRHFYLGDEWIYYKLYCGNRSADMILTDAIRPLALELLNQKYIDQWFFIRFAESGSHLRIRFHMKDISHLGAVIATVSSYLGSYLEQGVIWSVQTDTYNREVERYGAECIEETEAIFHLDSQFCVDALNLVEDDKLVFLLSMASIDGFLNRFNVDIDQKVTFTKKVFESFKREFQAEKHLNKQLNLKYQSLQNEIRIFINEQPEEFAPLYFLLNKRNSDLNALAENVDQVINEQHGFKTDYLKHQIHMMVNRIFRDHQRLHELVCYSCLYRFYQSQKNKV